MKPQRIAHGSALCIFLLSAAGSLSAFAEPTEPTRATQQASEASTSTTPPSATGDETTRDSDEGRPESFEQLLGEVESTEKRIVDLRARVQKARGDRRELLLPELEEVRTAYRRKLNQAATRLARESPRADELPMVEAARAHMKRALRGEGAIIQREVDHALEEIASTSARAKSAKPEERANLARTRDASLEQAPRLLGQLHENLESRVRLGADASAARARLQSTLERSSKLMSGTLHDIADSLERLEEIKKGEGTPEQATQKRDLEGAASLVVELQRKNLALMDEYGLETVQLRQDLIATTGEVSHDILDLEIARGLFERWAAEAVDGLAERASAFAFNAVSFLFVLLLFVGLSRIGRWLARRAVASTPRLSSLASDFVVKFSGRVILGVGLVIAAAQVGIEVGPLLAGLGIAGFVLGFALQDTLSNFASGMMILMYRPFDVGDVVEAGGVYGTVRAMNLVSTSIVTFDNQMLIVPNNKVWGEVIRNVTHQPTRRVDLLFGIGYDDDSDRARRVLEDILMKDPRVLSDPEPLVRMHELGDSSVNFAVRPWVNTADYWEAHWGITSEVKRRFDLEGISIPFPQRDVHVYETAKTKKQLDPSSDVRRSPKAS